METPSRLPEIDLFRGIAILMMVVFHTVFDISFFGIAPLNVSTGFWHYFAYATASLFLLIVGVSLIVSHARARLKNTGLSLALKFVYRGAFIFALGLAVTLGTWLYLGEGFVIFGILHLIGISVLLSPLFFPFRKWNLILGCVCIAVGLFVTGSYGPVYLLPLGIHPQGFTSVDYTPLFPWFGVVLIGMGIGEFLYHDGERRFTVPPIPESIVPPLSFLGRHSLLIYLVHQPIIIAVLATVTGIPPFP
ncbi:MAG: heparan-alpha-glucosaminide N-acetyltransferase [Methanoregula sp.]|nr:heparan-alpha-glucosaminide N-acetyltransferase [Methanoregula sp.]